GGAFIVRGGDVGHAGVLEELAALAPVTAVRGNNDKAAWAGAVPETEVLQVGAVRIYVVHDLGDVELDPEAAGFRGVVSGHSHRPSVAGCAGVLYVNPGSAGPRRFKLPITVGE